ncbi:hypothetical protein FRC07_001708 [Ceratobasidium sp. 392]|nr:hypothetical protein FRC07_001708 [Ceratobasidium sp. 392]
MQPHYARAYFAQGGYYTQPNASQPMQITIPSPGFARNQPMASLVPVHMRNRVGPARCGHEGCLFAGSHKEVEVHKMDRHLIFPPGWEDNQAQRKRKRGKEKEGDEDEEHVDEEAQFRATGSAAILGTDTKLDSPEAIAAWLEERKKRWPSAKRMAEKAQTRREALERGQIITEPQISRRSNSGGDRGNGASSQRGRGRGRGRGRDITQNKFAPEGGNRGTDMGWGRRARGRGRGAGGGVTLGGERGRGRGGAHPGPPARAPDSSKLGENSASTSSSSTSTESSSDSGSDSSSDSGSDDGSESDMDPVRDAISSKAAPANEMHMEVEPIGSSKTEHVEAVNQEPALSNQPAAQIKKQPYKKRATQPPRPAYNPFDQRPSLLRNLLMPDIQATVSNLSQAIRFLVANDFLENVEFKPGDAGDVLVQPMDTDSTERNTE